MKKQETHSDFKAVEFMRKKRNELSDLYAKSPKEFWKQLEEVRNKYKNRFHKKLKRTA